MQFKKIAIVYDWIDKWGGVERVLLTLHEMFPTAHFYTSYYDSKKAKWANKLHIKSSFIQKIPQFIKKNRVLSLPFYPYVFESFDFKDYDVVISVTSSFAKSVITRPETLHICYLLTPTRYLWICPEDYVKNPINKIISSPFSNQLKKWDFITARRPDYIVSISQTVSDRCKKYYQLPSDVIYPPFDIKYWEGARNGLKPFPTLSSKKFFLVVSRLEPYKKVDLVINVFNKLPELNLVIVGQGSQLKKLKKSAKRNIEFVEYIEDKDLANYYSQAEALIMMQEEDFGYVALEAQFFGCPVVAYKKGGAEETVIENKTGLFFTEQKEDDLIRAIERFNKISYNLKESTKELGPKNIEKFAKLKFVEKFQSYINLKIK